MVSNLFDDTIVSATELKKNQKTWFEKAYTSPVSITSTKGRNFVLINRELMSTIYKTKELSEELIKYCFDLKQETETGEFQSDAFPWAKYLSKEERATLGDELLRSFISLTGTDNMELINTVISEWKATAEALSNDKFMEIIHMKKSDRSFTKID